MSRARGVALLLLALGPARPAHAGWSSIGAMPRPERDGDALVYRNASATVAVTVLAPDVVRVRFASGPLGRDHSYAVARRDLGDRRATIDITDDHTLVTTAALRITIHHDPFRIAFADAAGVPLDEDDPERGLAWAGTASRVAKRLEDDDHVYGFGEKTGPLDKRGNHLGGTSYAMWNSDVYGYDDATDPLYASVPFFLVLRRGVAHGVLLDNAGRTSFDVGKESPALLTFGAETGGLDYYLVYGPAPKRVLARYADLTGHMPLPPRWALGYHQCRYSYFPEARVRAIAESLRRRRIPADVVWLDIDYQDGFRPFTWDASRFPDPQRMIADLRAQGLRLVTILDPHPKKQAGDAVYDSGLAGGHFVRRADGSLYEAPVWPAHAEREPGPSVFPDFTRPATREWWGGLLADFVRIGVAGIWNDMDEPAVFDSARSTFPGDVRHDDEGAPTDHRAVHNVYGMLTSRATFEGLRRLRPNVRPFVLTRSSFAGGQRYAALWPGDNTSSWAHLQMSIPMLEGLGLSGFPFVGSDIGGFIGRASPELFTRWMQLGVFYPFMRAHAEKGTPDKEPWAFGARHEALNREAIELRYELLPEVYNVMEEASRTGVPALRPPFLEYPDDRETYARSDVFLFGPDLLVAPVVEEGATERAVYLPKDTWYDLWSGAPETGGRTIRVPVTIESIPIFVRAGAFVFRQPVVQHTGEMPGQPLLVDVVPAQRSAGQLYEDDGESLDHERGGFARRTFAQRRERGATIVTVGAVEGSYRPAPRALVLRVWEAGAARRVLVGAETWPAVALASLDSSPRGWAAQPNGTVLVRLPDRAAAFEVRIEP